MLLKAEPALHGLEPAEVGALRQRVLGPVIAPDSPDYDAARRVWNRLVDRRPALIVRAADAADVIQALGFARAHDLPVAVRSGGHSIAGHGTIDGGLVLDLSAMNALSMDPGRRVAWAQPGVTWGAYAEQAHRHGLATPAGDSATVGVGGLTLGGGIGWLVRKHGLTIDSLLAVELVTADGRLLTASTDEHPDLFWALRGGGGNFGVATGFRFRLHPVGEVLGGVVFLRATAEALEGYLRYASEAPEGLSTIALVMPAPPLPFLPANQHGSLSLAVFLCHAGDPDEGQHAVASLRALGEVMADQTGPMPYPALFRLTAEGTIPRPHSIRSMYLRSLDGNAIRTLLDHLQRGTSPTSMVQLRVLGGAMSRVPGEATAFAHRDKPLFLAIMNAWEDPAEVGRHHTWTEQLWELLRPLADGVYQGFLGDEGVERIRAAYPPATYARLADVKRRYDPGNFFRLNQNIAPAA